MEWEEDMDLIYMVRYCRGLNNDVFVMIVGSTNDSIVSDAVIVR